MEVIKIGQSAGSKAKSGTRCIVGVNLAGIWAKKPVLFIVILANANKHPCAAAKKPIRGLAGIFQCFPTDFQEQAMLGIQTHRLTWRYAKKLGVKSIYLGEKTAFSGVNFAD